jgi:hypothetical protein
MLGVPSLRRWYFEENRRFQFHNNLGASEGDALAIGVQDGPSNQGSGVDLWQLYSDIGINRGALPDPCDQLFSSTQC